VKKSIKKFVKKRNTFREKDFLRLKDDLFNYFYSNILFVALSGL